MFLAEEVTNAWVETFKAGRDKNSDSLDIAEAVLRTLMSDRLCSAKRMAVWAAFIGHAGTHAAFAKIIRAMDDALTEQLSRLWQEAGYGAKAAGTHARQLQSLIRGHWLMSALSDDEKRPSAYIEPWVELLRGVPPSDAEPEAKTKAKSVSAPKHKKPMHDAPPNQLDFGDLFSKE